MRVLWIHRKKLPGLANFAAYLDTLTRNHIFSQLRRLATEEAYLRELISSHKLENKNNSDVIFYNALKKMLANALSHLPPPTEVGMWRKFPQSVKNISV